jgi:hypothetical protein
VHPKSFLNKRLGRLIAQNDPKKAGGDETGEIYNGDDVSCPDIVLRGICTRLGHSLAIQARSPLKRL